MFRGVLVRESRIMKESEFADLVVKFKCKNNPMTNEPLDLEFTKAEFTLVAPENAKSLFKLCALKMGLTTETSIKY